jgi:transposase
VRVAPPVELSPEERARLQRLRGRGGLRRRRAEIVLLAAEGLQDLEIGRRVGVDRQTAARWRRKFLTSRIGGLDARRAANRVGRIPEETLQAIVRTTVARSPPGGRSWSTRRLARELGVSHMTVRRVWESYGIRPVRFEASPSRADPTSSRAPWDVIGLYLTTSVAALVVTLHPAVAAGAAPRASGGRTDSFSAQLTFTGGGSVARTAPAFRTLPPRSEERRVGKEC